MNDHPRTFSNAQWRYNLSLFGACTQCFGHSGCTLSCHNPKPRAWTQLSALVKDLMRRSWSEVFVGAFPWRFGVFGIGSIRTEKLVAHMTHTHIYVPGPYYYSLPLHTITTTATPLLLLLLLLLQYYYYYYSTATTPAAATATTATPAAAAKY